MEFEGLNIEYRVSPRRKSIGIMVTTAGNVVVTLPRGASKESLALALTKHRAWIEAKVAERQAAWGRLKAGEAYFLGRPFRLTAVPGGPGRRVPERGRNQGPPVRPRRSLVPPATLVPGAGLGAASGAGERFWGSDGP